MIKMRNVFYLFFLLFISPVLLLAQKNFQPGLVVLNSGDTIKGFVDYQEWASNPKKINFQPVGEMPVQVLTVSDIAYFEINGNDAYQRVAATIDQAPVAISRVEHEGFRLDVFDTVFLRVLLKGSRLALYELIDDKSHFFLQEKEGQPKELIYRVFHDKSSVGNIYRLHTYRDQLKVYATEPATLHLIENSLYNQKQLVKVIEALDKTAVAIVTLPNKRQKQKVFRFIAGPSINFSGMKGVGIGDDKESMKDAAAHIGITGGVNIFSARERGRFIFSLLLGYTQYNWNSQYQRDAPNSAGTQKEIVSFRLAMNTFSFAPFANYAFYNTAKIKVYGGMGLQFNYSVYPVNEYKVENSSSISNPERNKYEFENLWASFPGRVGVNLKHFDIFVSKNLMGGFSSVQSFKGKYGSQGLTVAYQF